MIAYLVILMIKELYKMMVHVHVMSISINQLIILILIHNVVITLVLHVLVLIVGYVLHVELLKQIIIELF